MSGTQSEDRTQRLTLDQWKGLNAQAGRSAIDDQECFWLENLQPIGPGNLVMLPDNAAQIFSAASGATITCFYCYVRGAQRYAIVFISDGSAHEVALPSGSQAVVANAGTFSSAAPYFPRVAAWGDSGILIVTTAPNGYWAWDGTLWPPGSSPSPSWLNGGTATAMPTGVSGNAVTVFQSRAIVADRNKIQISAPSNGASFAASLGGTIFTSSDPFLQQAFMDLQQASGFLYLFGDSSVNALSNIQTSGSPATTTFYNANVDPQTGHAFGLPGVAFGRALCFANATGVYALLGGAARKVSDKLNNMFGALSASPVPSMGLVNLNGVRCLAVLIGAANPLGVGGNYIMLWDGEKWFAAVQTKIVTQVAMSMHNSAPQLWGTDGTALFQCFAGSPSTVPARLVTKFYPGPDPLAVKSTRSIFLGMNGQAATATVTAQSERGNAAVSLNLGPTATWFNSSHVVAPWTNNVPETVPWGYSGEQLLGSAANVSGNLVGFDISFTARSLSIARLLATFDDVADIGR